jgi:hypothetical protein
MLLRYAPLSIPVALFLLTFGIARATGEVLPGVIMGLVFGGIVIGFRDAFKPGAWS